MDFGLYVYPQPLQTISAIQAPAFDWKSLDLWQHAVITSTLRVQASLSHESSYVCVLKPYDEAEWDMYCDFVSSPLHRSQWFCPEHDEVPTQTQLQYLQYETWGWWSLSLEIANWTLGIRADVGYVTGWDTAFKRNKCERPQTSVTAPCMCMSTHRLWLLLTIAQNQHSGPWGTRSRSERKLQCIEILTQVDNIHVIRSTIDVAVHAERRYSTTWSDADCVRTRRERNVRVLCWRHTDPADRTEQQHGKRSR